MNGLPKTVRIVEVGPRDGLQNEDASIPLEAKVQFIDLLSRSGLREIEVTSFVSPVAVPQLADAADVLKEIAKTPGVRYPVLVPNVRGLERWLTCLEWMPPGSRGVSLFTAASETFNQRNIRSSIDESLTTFELVIDRLRRDVPDSEIPFVRGYISTAFICPYEGVIEPHAVVRVARRLMEMGVQEISVGDTIGAATPVQVVRLLESLLPFLGAERLALHFHDTRGGALANVLASLQAGVSVFDSSAGGLGGCPYAPGAGGNLATEDLVYFMDGLGVETGVRLCAVAEASQSIAPHLGHGLPSKALAAFQAAGF